MNSEIMRRLLDIELIPEDAENLRFGWEQAWPGWVWAVLLSGAVAFALWSYLRLDGRRWGRGWLALTRFAGLSLILVLLCGPLLEMPRERVEQDWVLALVDRSASMQLADVEDGDGRITREEQLHRLLASSSETWLEIEKQHRVIWLGFDAGTFSLDRATEDEKTEFSLELGEADGDQTWLGRALEQALSRAAARPISGVLLFTDGSTGDPPSRTLLRRLQLEMVGVYSLPLGSPDPVSDQAIGRVEAPRRAFIRDKVPVTVFIDHFGGVGEREEGTVRLIDIDTGEELDRRELTLEAGGGESITLTAAPQLTGTATWRVVVETAKPDLIPANNFKSFRIELVDRPLRVLYVEGYPRWEYRYLKNLLLRERTLESSMMLLSADRDFAQEGDRPLTRLPNSREEFSDYDVIVIGDVPSSSFRPDQLAMIRRQVGELGAGLLWIGGERYTPRSYRGTDLSDLLPLRGNLELERIDRPVNLISTPRAAGLGVLRLTDEAGGDLAEVSASGEAGGTGFFYQGWPEELSDASYGWSRLYFAQHIRPGLLKPAAEVIGETVEEFAGEPLPLVISMQYGAGLTIYVATDEIWRWRYGRGEYYPDQFWVQLIRALGRRHLAGAGDRATLEISPPRVAVDGPVHVRLRLLDQSLTEERRNQVLVVIEDETGQEVGKLSLSSEGRGGLFGSVGETGGTGGSFSASWFPDRVGSFRLRVDDPDLAGLSLEAELEVFAPDDELRHPETDHGLLLSLAASTGGRVLKLDEVEQLPNLLPKRSVTTDDTLTERIWDTPLAFAALMLLLTMEWVGRKVMRLG